MSGHSKWATIKHKKGKTDARRGKLFSKLSRAITVAAREGGADAAMNIALANAVEKAKSYSMPKENIERAIQRGGGGADGERLREHPVRGLRPGRRGDHRRGAHRQQEPLRRRGAQHLQQARRPAGAARRRGLGVRAPRLHRRRRARSTARTTSWPRPSTPAPTTSCRDGEQFQVLTQPADFAAVRDAARRPPASSASRPSSRMIPKTTVKLEENDARKTLKIIDALEDSDDVQEVYANFDIPEDVLEALAG